jgi:hypothetical protein
LGSLKEGDHPEEMDVFEMIKLKWLLRKQSVKAWNGYIRLRIGSNPHPIKCQEHRGRKCLSKRHSVYGDQDIK